ncbi:3051_t:CDS:2, partial [Gigaspora margarita]
VKEDLRINVEENLEHLASQISKLVLRDKKENQDSKQQNIISKQKRYEKILIERKEYRNLANNCYRKRKQNNEWREQYQIGELEDKINGKEKADKEKSTNRNQNIKVNGKDNLESMLESLKEKIRTIEQ